MDAGGDAIGAIEVIHDVEIPQPEIELADVCHQTAADDRRKDGVKP